MSKQSAYTNPPAGDKEYVEQLIGQLGWDDEEARRARTALERMPSKRVVPHLIATLHDADEYIRMAACDLLNGFTATEALPELVRLAEDDSDLQVRNHADIAIRHIQSERH